MFQDNQPQTNQPVQPEAPQQQQVTQAPQAPQAPIRPVQTPEKTTQEERMWAVIGYIAFLGFVTLAINTRSPFCKHHAANGLAIFGIWFVGLIVLAMPSFIGAIGGIILLIATVMAVLGILKAIQSYKFEFPVLSSIAKLIPTDTIIGSVTGKIPDPTPQTPQEPAQPVQPVQPTQEPTQQQGGSDENQTPPAAPQQ